MRNCVIPLATVVPLGNYLQHSINGPARGVTNLPTTSILAPASRLSVNVRNHLTPSQKMRTPAVPDAAARSPDKQGQPNQGATFETGWLGPLLGPFQRSGKRLADLALAELVVADQKGADEQLGDDLVTCARGMGEVRAG